jgi:phosphonate transport system ATP-binding protein
MPATEVPADTPAVVRFRDVVRTYDRTTALDIDELTVTAGEVVVLLGLSGSGKSTLLRHVNGLERPTSGTVTVLDTHPAALSPRELRALRRRIAFVFQQFELVGPLTVLENVLTGALGRLRGPRLGIWSYPKSLRHSALERLERVGLLDRAYQRADTLSGGQQQRVAIARALLQQPEILLADEPVASLDPESADEVMTLIREIAAENRLTVLCSLHQVELALSWADRLVGLRSGQIVLDTPTAGMSRDEVMRIYRRVTPTGTELAQVAAELAQESAARAQQTPAGDPA